jgi:hypothetical protein
MDHTERLLREYLQEMRLSASNRSTLRDFPDTEDFVLYCQDELEGEALVRFERCLTSDRRVQDMVLEAKRLMEEELPEQEIPAGLVEKAKRLVKNSGQSAPCPHCGKHITPFKRPTANQKWTNLLWLLLTVISFALSFVFRRYFMQFLALTVIAGVRWAVEMRASKTQIMIYRALSEDPEKPAHRLKQFQENEP